MPKTVSAQVLTCGKLANILQIYQARLVMKKCDRKSKKSQNVDVKGKQVYLNRYVVVLKRNGR